MTPRRTVAAIAAWVLGAAVLGGCASVPTGGRVDSGRSVERTEPIDDPYVRLVPASPGRDWEPDDIVRGFLTASASFDDHHKVAREYLTRSADGDWKPDDKPQVIVHDAEDAPVPPDEREGPDSREAELLVRSRQVARITLDGQYLVDPKPPRDMVFGLVKDAHGQWRIDELPRDLRDGGLLLSRRDVDRAFRVMYLHFWEPQGQVLVPNGVFLPMVGRQELAGRLVKALLEGPTAWLKGAVGTDFPSGTRLLRGVQISEGVATVDLSAEAFRGNRQRMSAQLVWTLARLEEIKQVRLLIDGEPIAVHDRQTQAMSDYLGFNPARPQGDLALVRGPDDSLSQLGSDNRTIRIPELSKALLYHPTTSLSPNRWVAGLDESGSAVLSGDMAGRQPVRQVLAASLPGGHFTTPSWDRRDTLWTVESAHGRSTLWALQDGGTRPVRVERWALEHNEVRALRVARDGVRVAAIVRVDGKYQLQLGRIEWPEDGNIAVLSFVPVSSELEDVRDLAWADANTLAVLGKTSGEGAQISPFRVPVEGSGLQQIGAGTLGESVTIAAAPGEPVLVGVTDPDRICSQTSPSEWYSQWECKPTGTEPAYPG